MIKGTRTDPEKHPHLRRQSEELVEGKARDVEGHTGEKSSHRTRGGKILNTEKDQYHFFFTSYTEEKLRTFPKNITDLH